MKKIFITLVTAVVSLAALPEKVEASNCNSRHGITIRIGTTSCGAPIYQRKVFVGYDCYRRPVYRYYSVPIRYNRSHYHSNRYRVDYSRYHNSNRYHNPHYKTSHYSRSYNSYHRPIRSCRY